MSRPSFFTVEEAARVLRIGRTAAYEGTKRYRETNGAEGIKVVAVGGTLRVPGVWLEELAGGPIDLDDLSTAPVSSLDAKRSEKRPAPLADQGIRTARSTRSARVKPISTTGQRSLPFSR